MLVYRHGHSDAPKRKPVVQKALTNGLDFDEAATVIAHASEDLAFIHVMNGKVWYVQERDVLEYIRDETAMDLSIISEKFDHVNYPTLLPRRIRASVLEGGALMWTPGNQSPAIGR